MAISLKKLEMRVRAITPRSVKLLWRASRVFEPVHTVAAPSPDQVADCRMCVSRKHMLEFLPMGGRVAELGTQRGHFARSIMEIATPSELHLIDIDYSLFDATGLSAPVVTRHQGLTVDIIKTFPDGYFDWIYIDADHSYQGCRADAEAAAPKVKPGGYLVFNDFAHIDPYLGRYGVQRAVMEFLNASRWQLAFWAIEVHGLYDVALKKPAP